MTEQIYSLKTALLISGTGSTAEAVIKEAQKQNGRLREIDPVVVIASTRHAGGLRKAAALKVPTEIVVKQREEKPEVFGARLLDVLRRHEINLVSQNGWLVHTPPNVTKTFEGRIINQHPGPLDPGRELHFGGQGMYGSRVTAARLAYVWMTGENKPWTSVATHFVTPEYDEGDLIREVAIDIPSIHKVAEDNGLPLTTPLTVDALYSQPWKQVLIDTTFQVQAELLPVEHGVVVDTLAMFGRRAGTGEPAVSSWRRGTPLIPQEHTHILKAAKQLAINMFPK